MLSILLLVSLMFYIIESISVRTIDLNQTLVDLMFIFLLVFKKRRRLPIPRYVLYNVYFYSCVDCSVRVRKYLLTTTRLHRTQKKDRIERRDTELTAASNVVSISRRSAGFQAGRG